MAAVLWPLLTPEDQQAAEAAGTRRVYQPETAVFREDDSSSFVMIVLEGDIKLSRTSAEGNQIIIEIRGPGTVLGELAAIDGARRNATGITVDRVEALVIPPERFHQLLLERPKISLAVLTIVGEKLRQATDRRLTAGTSDATSQLAGRLVELAGDAVIDADGMVEIVSPLTQQELADWIGVSRDAIVIALRTMRSNGWIETGRRTIRIYDIEALRTRAGMTAPRLGPPGS